MGMEYRVVRVLSRALDCASNYTDDPEVLAACTCPYCDPGDHNPKEVAREVGVYHDVPTACREFIGNVEYGSPGDHYTTWLYVRSTPDEAWQEAAVGGGRHTCDFRDITPESVERDSSYSEDGLLTYCPIGSSGSYDALHWVYGLIGFRPAGMHLTKQMYAVDDDFFKDHRQHR